ncbi:hypothetical protein E8E14_003386 [Neopestalotiopsis sp. 37M]|nr:hypothetical protein E8E14_003386 [Neopestalotiopsis sp. 37M]
MTSDKLRPEPSRALIAPVQAQEQAYGQSRLSTVQRQVRTRDWPSPGGYRGIPATNLEDEVANRHVLLGSMTSRRTAWVAWQDGPRRSSSGILIFTHVQFAAVTHYFLDRVVMAEMGQVLLHPLLLPVIHICYFHGNRRDGQLLHRRVGNLVAAVLRLLDWCYNIYFILDRWHIGRDNQHGNIPIAG